MSGICKSIILITLAFFIHAVVNPVFSQTTISGVVKDSKTNETLIGANVVIKGSTIGDQTDIDGKFDFKYNGSYPVILSISFIGYNTTDLNYSGVGELTVKLKSNEVMLSDIEVVGSRISEKQKEAPLTVESMDLIAIRETPAANFYDGLGQLKGVDLTSASIGFKIINTRGFNSSSPVRSLQIIDGVDNASPGLNFSLGNFLGASDLDVAKVDLVVGASSAFYGPNAFNGVISMTTRSPFINPGLEVSTKIGNRGLFENAIRFSDVIKDKNNNDKFAYKLNVFRLDVYDWPANNLDATPQSKTKIGNPGGYDAVNIYGDEFINGLDFSSNAKDYPGLGIISRKGYLESDLVDYKTENLKLGTSLHYKLNPNIELIYAFNFGSGNTIYQGDNRYALRDIRFYQNRLEVRNPEKWFVRGYSTKEDAGNSYDLFFTSLLLQNSAKSLSDWTQDYVDYWYAIKNQISSLPGFPQPSQFSNYTDYIAAINPFLQQNYPDTLQYFHNQAQAFVNGIGNPLNANPPFLEVGSAEFDTAFASITSKRSFSEGGSKFYDKSALYHVHGEYKFTPKFADIIIGANFRWYRPESDGTIFSDTNGVVIKNEEGGVYLGAEKKLANEKLKISLTGRVDKNVNFNYLFSPAASAVYNIHKNHILRTSFSSAIRNPTLADQYLYYPVGRAILVGNKDGYDSLVTVPSLINYFDYNSKFDTLEFFSLNPVRPEEVKTVEIGYRATIGKRLYIDLGAYHSWYKYFIGYRVGADVDVFETFTISFLGDTIFYNDLRFNNVVRVASNANDRVTTSGFSIGLNYYLGKYFAVTSNYSYNKLDKQGSDDPLIPAFNTPEHKYNIGFNGRDINGFGFSINYKWVDGFEYEGSPQFTGYLDSYDVVDAQVNYKFKDEPWIVKVGSSNILNNKHYEIFGGPLVGRLYYLSLSLSLSNEKFRNSNK
ncbi:MAG: TonB-dependent receptor [Bacteroidota bacterium]|jgi:iron complex outermembrane receptor protein